jgi:adenylate cyclase
MNGAPTRGWFLVWPALVIVTGLALHVFNPGGLVSALQGRSLVTLERLWPRDKLAPASPAAPPVRYVDIDAASLAREGPWPWPRADLGRLVASLSRGGARVVVLDFALDHPDPTAPARTLRSLPDTPESEALKAAVAALPSSDAALAQALAQARAVTRFSLLARGGTPAPEIPGALAAPSKRILHGLPEWAGAQPPLPLLVEKSTGVGAAFPAASGDTVLGVPLVYNVAGAVRPSLALEAVRLALGTPAATLTVADPRTRYEALLGRPGLAAIHLGSETIPVSRSGIFWYHAAAGASAAAIPAWRVLEKRSAEDVRDAVVVIGASGPENATKLKSPLGPRLASSALLVDRIRQILDHAFIERPIWAEAGEELFMLVCGIALLLLLGHAPLSWPIATTLAAVLGAGYLSGIAFARQQWFLDPLFPSLTIALALGVGVASRWRRSFDEAEERRIARASFAPQTVRADGRPATGEERMVTVLACDIRNFADLLARYTVSADALARLLRAYEHAMGEIIVKNRGAVALIRGGHVLAAFNASQNDSEHAANACNCALRMIDALERLNGTLADEARAEAIAFEPVTVTMGISTGAGLVSPPQAGLRPELLPVGATVALAETLQGHAEDYGSAIIVDETTREQAQKLFALLEIDLVHLPRRAEPLHVFALLGNPLVKASPKFRALQATHDEIFAAYRAQNWQLARALIRECRKLPAAAAPLYDLYESRIADLEH